MYIHIYIYICVCVCVCVFCLIFNHSESLRPPIYIVSNIKDNYLRFPMPNPRSRSLKHTCIAVTSIQENKL